ncbi:MAG: helix-turn-helix transcriptional regulator [Clostridia bacterium]|nr:helix-turn-helix transcriptional regulator [Clostridia bacterium]
MNFLVFLFVKCYNLTEGCDFLLSDNIRKYRKSKQMSQDELAEKLEVTRQSISLWETGQTQPSLDNIVALAKLFDISTDALLTDNETKPVDSEVTNSQSEKPAKKKTALIIAVSVVVVFAVILIVFLWKKPVSDFSEPDTETFDTSVVTESIDSAKQEVQSDEDNKPLSVLNETESKKDEGQSVVSEKNEVNVSEAERDDNKPPVSNETTGDNDESQSAMPEKVEATVTEPEKKEETQPVLNNTDSNQDKGQTTVPEKTETVAETPNKDAEKNIFDYLKNFVIQNGTVNGDYCYYSKSADNYGGYESESFSLYYWGDTDKIEFCLHSVLDETFSINFYIYVPKRHTGDYKYISSYYFRDTGEPLYEAEGVIKGAQFTKSYPLNCDEYYGSTEVQDEFMEMSRQGICDLIDCLKNFIEVENLEYSFYDFGFEKF